MPVVFLHRSHNLFSYVKSVAVIKEAIIAAVLSAVAAPRHVHSMWRTLYTFILIIAHNGGLTWVGKHGLMGTRFQS